MEYPHTVIVTRVPLTIGTGGKAVEGTAIELYNGPADAQENDRRHDVSSGLKTAAGSCRVYFPKRLLYLGCKPGDAVTIYYPNGVTRTGNINQLDHLDDSALVLYG